MFRCPRNRVNFIASPIEGASEAEIERVRLAVKGPLPPDYEMFSGSWGTGTMGSLAGGDIATFVEDVLEFYEELVGTGETSVPDDCIVIGVGDLSIDELYLEREAPNRVFGSANDAKDLCGRRRCAAFSTRRLSCELRHDSMRTR